MWFIHFTKNWVFIRHFTKFFITPLSHFVCNKEHFFFSSKETFWIVAILLLSIVIIIHGDFFGLPTFNKTSYDQKDYIGISTSSKVLDFVESANPVSGQLSGFSGSIDLNFSGISTNPTGNKVINLGAVFTNGMAAPEINKGSGDVIYLDNRPLISRNSRQKEDVKIILEF